MASSASITIYRGEEVLLNFTMAPVEDIGAWTLLFTVAKAQNSPSKLITQAATIVSGVGGTFSVSLDADQSKDVKPGTYFYDVWRMDSEAERVVAAGAFVILGNARLPV